MNQSTTIKKVTAGLLALTIVAGTTVPAFGTAIPFNTPITAFAGDAPEPEPIVTYDITAGEYNGGSVAAYVNDEAVTSAEAETPLTIKATPDKGYKVDAIFAKARTAGGEILVPNGNTTTVTGANYKVSSAIGGNGNNRYWNLVNYGNNKTLTIESLDGQKLSSVNLTIATNDNSRYPRNSNALSVDGTATLSFDDGFNSGSLVTISNINATSVTLTFTAGNNDWSSWTFNVAAISGEVDSAVQLTNTEDAAVKTAAMPKGKLILKASFVTKVQDVIGAIIALPEPENVTAADAEAIAAARAAFDELPEEMQSQVYSDYQAKLAADEKAVAVKVADALVEALPAPDKVTVDDETAITKARAAYDALDEGQKAACNENTITKLKADEEALAAAKAAAKKAKEDKEAADAVKSKIDKLPAAKDVEVSDKNAIVDARKAYEALTDDQKKLVDDSYTKKLAEDEAALAAAEKEAARVDISAAEVKVNNKTYTGNALTPNITVTLDGKTLVKGTDFTVKYSKNVKPGVGKATVTGINDYKGTAKGEFKVKPAVAKFTSVKSSKKGRIELKWKKDKLVTGYQIQVSKSKTFTTKKLVKNVWVKKNATVSKTFKGVKAGKYFVRIRAYKQASGKKVYGNYSAVKKITVK